MNKKNIFIGIILVFIVGAGSFYFYLKTQKATLSNIYKAVPIQVSLIIDLKNPTVSLKKLLKKNDFWQELTVFDEVFAFNEQLKFIDSVAHYQIKSDLIHSKPLVISFHELGNRIFKPIFYTRLNGKMEAKQLLKEIEQQLENKGTISTDKYNKVKIYDFKFSDVKNKHFYYCYYRGIFILSPSELLLQESLRQVDADVGLNNNKEFLSLLKTANANADANIYVQFKPFKRLFGKLLDVEKLKKMGIINYSEWGVFDLNMKNKTLLINGFSGGNNEKTQMNKIFVGQAPQQIKFVKHITNIPEAFSIIEVSDVHKFREKLVTYMDEIGEKARLDINEKSLEKAFGKEVIKDFEKLIKNEIAVVTQADGSLLCALQTKGNRAAKEFVEDIFTYFCNKNSKSLKNYKKNYRIDKETSFSIYKMPLAKVPLRLFGSWFSYCEAEYLAVFENYIVFADTYKSITNFIYDNVLQKTFAYNGDYKKFENYLSEKVNFYHFVNLSGTGSYISGLLTPKSKKYWQKNQKNIGDFYAIGFQFSSEKNYLYNSLIFRHQKINTMQASTEWESKIDTTMSFKPALIKNHYTGEKEIFLQDDKNSIYLIGNNGRIIWKRKFEAPILSNIEQVDFYKNGKIQLLFNTADKIYLLDRNGNNVERYPITLPQKATAPLAIFDYEKNRNYRIFVPCDKKIYAFNLEGNIVTGFNFSGSDFSIQKPIQYFRSADKDYLIIADKQRTYILDRRGNERVKLDQQFIPSEKNAYSLIKSKNIEKTRFVTSDEKGNINYIYLNGKVEKRTFDKFSKKHYFKAYDIDNDGISEYIFIDKNKLYIYNSKGKKIFEHKFEYKITDAPSFYKFSSNKTGMGITEAEAGKIYLFDDKGKLFEGFPLKGKTPFSIAPLKPNAVHFNLLVGGNDFYLYNYRLK